uniref:CMP-N-acetylneuraminate-beta-galactosamide-alpha-2,3-sialyltransferase 1 n=1 Tax=Oryzias latipes TaxID=8090 RepID=A0A3P9HNY8_ORYLA
MSPLPRNKFWTFFFLCCILTFTTLLCSYTFTDPPFHFFKYASRISGSFFSKDICACDSCMADVGDDAWLADHFNLSILPLMTRDNSALSEDTYRWWQWLQREGNPANYTQVVEELFRLIPDEGDFMDAGPQRCRTCSVVGNSGNLKGSNYGALIDTSDLVIRMNKAPTKGFEKDVGAKTTHHVMYPESAVDLSNTTSLVLVPFKTLDLQWIISALTTGTIRGTYMPVKSWIKANKNKVVVINPRFIKYVYESWLEGRGHYPSTGFLTLMFALHICDEVNVFGFGADQHGNWHHYWEHNQLAGAFRHTGVHDGDYEYNLTLTLADKHKIQMFRGR